MFSVPSSTAMSAGEPSPVGAPIGGGTTFQSDPVGFDKMIDPGPNGRVRRAAKRAMNKTAAAKIHQLPLPKTKVAPVKTAPVTAAPQVKPAPPKLSDSGGLTHVKPDVPTDMPTLTPAPKVSEPPKMDTTKPITNNAKGLAEDVGGQSKPPPSQEKSKPPPQPDQAPPPADKAPETGSPAPGAGKPKMSDADRLAKLEGETARAERVRAGTHTEETAYKEILPGLEGRASRWANTTAGRMAIDMGSFMLPSIAAGIIAPESELLQIAAWPAGMVAGGFINQKFAKGSQRAQTSYIAGHKPAEAKSYWATQGAK